MNILQIVPRLPPAIDGVGDYALNLARQLRQDFSIHTHFLVCDPHWKGKTEIEGFSVSQIDQRSAESFFARIPQEIEAILLHYVGAGYAERGVPVWLVEGLEKWNNETIHSHLVTMFHELYSYWHPPWKSAFWLSFVKQNLVTRLARMSHHCLTNRQNNAKRLQEFTQKKHNEIIVLPVISNIGEPSSIPPLFLREQKLVIFGRKSSKIRAYQKAKKQIQQVCNTLNLKEIIDIGDPIELGLSSVGEVPIRYMGRQSATNLSSILLNTQVGFLNYNPGWLSKSGIFATYAAHGMMPINASNYPWEADKIKAGKHYWTPTLNENKINNFSLDEMQEIANSAYAWYSTHNLSTQAYYFTKKLSTQ